jgi:hypothetical protein
MQNFNTLLKLISVGFLITFITACSNTSNYADHSLTNNNLTERNVEKKAFTSDHQLLLSLLNRPLPKDQQMMMKFARVNNENNWPRVGYVSIRGDRSEDNSALPETFAYSQLIYRDQNSIAIGAPR